MYSQANDGTPSGTPDPVASPLGQILENYPELEACVDAPCRAILAHCAETAFEPGTILFQESDPCRNFMWLTEGTVRIYKHSEEGRELTLYRVNPGELCLLSINSLLSDRPYPAAARAETPVRGLAISGLDFQRCIDESAGFRRYVLGTLSERINHMMTLVTDVAFRRLDLRLACLLGHLFERSSGEPLRCTHAQLARELGTTREVISRILKEFEHQGCVRLERGRIHLESEQGLEWFGQKNA